MEIRTGIEPRETRKNRKPNFPIAGTMRPFGLYPIFAHPVLPGETLQSMSTKLRVLSMPVKHPLVGAWLETWLCYVKFTDIDPDLGQMFISDSYPTTGFTAGASKARYFVKSGQVDWIRLCTEAVHKAYFVHENETPRTIDGVPLCKINNVSWYQNMIFEDANVAVPTSDASDLYEHLTGWMMLQQMSMTELTYEKYLETYGVRAASVRKGDPEILSFSRAWTQPTNVVDPANGSPSSAWVWNGDSEVKKAKRFDEPGFVLMLATVRPKVYNYALDGSMIGEMWGFSDWFPSYNLKDPTASVKEFLKNKPIFRAAHTDAGTEKLLYDHKDLLNHGEQFVNVADADAPYSLPYSTGMSVKTGSNPEDLRGEYVKDTDVDNLFKGNTTQTRYVYYEGISHLVISGHVMDTTR